jgi:hypothetical protein
MERAYPTTTLIRIAGDPSYLDVLLCAGDVSNRDSVVEETCVMKWSSLRSGPTASLSRLALFAQRYDYVFFTPGNHDVWAAAGDSLQRIGELFDVCQRHRVVTQRAVRFCIDGAEDVVVLPLLSWYDDAFDVEPEMVRRPLGKSRKTFSCRQSVFACDACSWTAQTQDLDYPANLNSRWVDYSLCKWGAVAKQPGFRFGPECGTS